MKKLILWLVPFAAIVLAAYFLLVPDPKRDESGAPEQSQTEMDPKETPHATPYPVIETAQGTKMPAPIAAQEISSSASRAAIEEFAGPVISGKLRWKGGPIPKDIEVTAHADKAIDGKEEFAGSVTDDGSFRIAVPEKFRMGKVSAQGDFHYAVPVSVERNEQNVFPLLSLSLKAGGLLRGVVRQPNGEPAANAKIFLGMGLDLSVAMTNPEGLDTKLRQTQSDAQGLFFFRHVPPGKNALLHVSFPGAASKIVDHIEIDPLQTKEVLVALERESIVEGLVLDAQANPIEGVKLRAIIRQGMGAMVQQSVLQGPIEKEGTALTGADGRFRIAGLAAGNCRLQATKSGFETWRSETLSLVAGETSSQKISLGRGQSIAGIVRNSKGDVVAGAVVSMQPDWMSGEFGMDVQWEAESLARKNESDAQGRFRFEGLGKGAFTIEASHDEHGGAKKERVRPGAKELELRLQPQGIVRGRVTAAGIGAAIPKFQIRATKQQAWMPVPIETAPFESKEGKYEIKNLSPGSIALAASAEGFANSSQSVEIRSGETIEVDFALVPAATVRGKVLAAGGNEAIEDAQISPAKGNNPFGWIQDMADRSRVKANSNQDGEFELTGLPAGKISLRATHAHYAAGNSEEFELAPGATIEGISIFLSPGGGIDGFVFDDEGVPVSQATVIANGIQGGSMKMGQTDANGYFSFDKGLSPGQYQLTSMSMATSSGNTEEEDANAAFLQGMHTAFAQVEEGKIARVILGEKKDGLCTVSGRVSAGGQAVAGAYVSLLPKSSDETSAGGNTTTEIGFAMSGKNGEFTLKNVAPGKRSFSVQRGNLGGAASVFEIDVPKTSEHRVELSLPGGRLAGRVTQAKTGEPLAGVWIMVAPKQGAANLTKIGEAFGQTQTDGEGRFQIEHLKAGQYRVSAGQMAFFPGSSASEFGRSTQTVILGDGQSREDVDFSLRPAAKLEGLVRASGGSQAPIPNASIHFLDSNDESVSPLSLVSTDASGHFTDTGMGAGSYTVVAQASGYVSGSKKISIAEGESASIEIYLSSGTQVSVKLLDAAGAAIDGATFQVFDEKGAPVASFLGVQEMMAAWTSGQKSGNYALGSVAPGNYRIVANKGDKTLIDTIVKVEATATQTIELKTSP